MLIYTGTEVITTQHIVQLVLCAAFIFVIIKNTRRYKLIKMIFLNRTYNEILGRSKIKYGACAWFKLIDFLNISSSIFVTVKLVPLTFCKTFIFQTFFAFKRKSNEYMDVPK